jgi:hypothetical protein
MAPKRRALKQLYTQSSERATRLHLQDEEAFLLDFEG